MSTRSILLSSILFSLILAGTPAQGASLVTRDGQTFTGKVLEKGSDYYLMELEDGVQVRIDKDQVVLFEKEDETEEAPPAPKRYGLVGVSFFYPAWGNLLVGYYLDDFGAKVTGGWWGPADWGVQLDLSMKLEEDREFLTTASVVLGATSPKSYLDRTYAGFGMDVTAAGFLLEGDLVGGKDPATGDFAPVLLFQLGYTIRID